MDSDPKPGDLRVWWIPQVPGRSFEVLVASIVEARLLLDTLAFYDEFQLVHDIKPDYCNAGGLTVWEPDGEGGFGWFDWYDSEGDDIDKFTLDELRTREASGTLPVWAGALEA